MPVDHFPSTHATWIDAQLTIAERAGAHTEDGQSARRALQQHLMQRYHEPLRAYVRGSSMRQLGDADELVGGFFADRVGAHGFLADWRESRMPLRRWLMNGISFYGRGVILIEHETGFDNSILAEVLSPPPPAMVPQHMPAILTIGSSMSATRCARLMRRGRSRFSMPRMN